MKRGLIAVLILIIVPLLLVSAGCGHKQPPPGTRTPLPPPARTEPTPTTGGPAPTIELQANPSTLERGQQSTLTWKTQSATSVVIDNGIGNVAESGSVVITPRESATFTATVKGPGGEAKASTRVTVVTPTQTGGVTSTDIAGLAEALRDGRIKDIFFDYDKADLSAEARTTLEQDARWIRQFPKAKLVLEGHCDERGTEEYNLALGDRRAQATKDYLVQLGVAEDQLETVSLGEEQPFAPGHDEAAYAQNRRAHFAQKQ